MNGHSTARGHCANHAALLSVGFKTCQTDSQPAHRRQLPFIVDELKLRLNWQLEWRWSKSVARRGEACVCEGGVLASRHAAAVISAGPRPSAGLVTLRLQLATGNTHSCSNVLSSILLYAAQQTSND